MNGIEIREARRDDFEFVTNLMVVALEPYYDGDHRAHATRIFTTHIKGGTDHVGHFSFEQRMFILTDGGVPVGMINIVGKKQGTYKISPIIISPSYQGKCGYGSLLLKYAEDYVGQKEVRQIYCTVAEKNKGALQFFLRNGYVVAGRSASHYKPGVTEVMLYKLYWDHLSEQEFDRPNISVELLGDHHKTSVRSLILSRIPRHFNGVDDRWVDALFEGYGRRGTHDVNSKFKLIFVATDRSGRVLGVIGATPKKGQPIKLMPCVAATPQAFNALITDIPQLLRRYGHKLYMHLVPSVQEVLILQRLGWTLDSSMPAAYHPNYVTQQWGFDLGVDFMRIMRVKQEFFDLIMSGRKTLEVRVGYPNIRQIKIGERICLSTHRCSGVIYIRDVRNYNNLDEMFARENFERVAPGKLRLEVTNLLRRIYPPSKEKLGVIVLEVAPE